MDAFPEWFHHSRANPVTVGMEVANDGFTFFPGGLTFPRASAGVTGLSVGLDAFTLLPDGFTLDTVPATFDGTILIGDIPIPIIDVPAVPGSATPPRPHRRGSSTPAAAVDRGSPTSARARRAGGTRGTTC